MNTTTAPSNSRILRLAQAHAALSLLLDGGHESKLLDDAREELRSELAQIGALNLGVNYGSETVLS